MHGKAVAAVAVAAADDDDDHSNLDSRLDYSTLVLAVNVLSGGLVAENGGYDDGDDDYTKIGRAHV